MKKTGEKSRKKALKKDDPLQSQRFVETARELGVNESIAQFEKTIVKITPNKTIKM